MKSLNTDILEYAIGLKLNNFKSPHSLQEKNKMIQAGREWLEQHPNDIIDLY